MVVSRIASLCVPFSAAVLATAGAAYPDKPVETLTDLARAAREQPEAVAIAGPGIDWAKALGLVK